MCDARPRAPAVCEEVRREPRIEAQNKGASTSNAYAACPCRVRGRAHTLPDVALTTVRVYGVRESIVGRHWYRHRYQLKIVWINP